MSSLADLLSPDDLAIMQLVAAGYTQQQISRRRGLRRASIPQRTHRIRERIGAVTTPHAVALLAADGALDLTQIHPISTGGTTR